MVRAMLRPAGTVGTFQALGTRIQKWCPDGGCIWGFREAGINSVSHN